MSNRSRTELLNRRLQDLQVRTPDIEACAIVSVDGLSIASSLPGGIEEDRVSAMSAAMLSLGERIALEMGRGTLSQVYIKGESGYIILSAIGEDAVLTVLAHEDAKLGLLFFDMKRAAEDLRILL
jgi:predicted regulator of Ras-like GTPase activity (Roadblock/LC7/MglB family)